jgi:hypothetical protein
MDRQPDYFDAVERIGLVPFCRIAAAQEEFAAGFFRGEPAKRGLRVGEYLTELPAKKLLEQQLHGAVRLAQARLAHAGDG